MGESISFKLADHVIISFLRNSNETWKMFVLFCYVMVGGE